MNRKKVSPWLMAFRVIFTLAMCCTVVFIFSHSIQDGIESSNVSGQVQQVVNGVMDEVGGPHLTQHQVRKLAHWAEFTLLGLWLQLCMRVYTVRFLSHISWPALGGLLVALSDETLQLYISGRNSSVLDVWLDMLGVCCGIAAGFVLLVILQGLLRLLWAGRKREEQKNDDCTGN